MSKSVITRRIGMDQLVRLICLGMFAVFPHIFLQAQEAKTYFVEMPDSLCPLLTKVNREDCIDFLESRMKAQVENRFGKTTEMVELGNDYIRLQITPQNDWQMKVLTQSDKTHIICIVSTACAPVCDSDIRFYTADWQQLPTSRFVYLPTMDDFLLAPDSASVYAFDEARRAADILLMKADFTKESTDLTFTLTTPEYMTKEMAEKLEPFLCHQLIYRWENSFRKRGT